MVSILAIDPGSSYSAWVNVNAVKVQEHGIVPNAEMLPLLRLARATGMTIVIERIEPRYGLRMGWETIETCEWIGRFIQAADGMAILLRRSDILRHFNVSGKGTADAGIRAALMDRYGGTASVRKGFPLYGIHTHEWAALSVAVAYQDGLR
jgi:hypothetical protein